VNNYYGVSIFFYFHYLISMYVYSIMNSCSKYFDGFLYLEIERTVLTRKLVKSRSSGLWWRQQGSSETLASYRKTTRRHKARRPRLGWGLHPAQGYWDIFSYVIMKNKGPTRRTVKGGNLPASMDACSW